MKQLIKGFIFWLLIGLTAFFIHANFIQKKPCEAPIEYRLGVLDERFGLDQEMFLNALTQASAIWEVPLGKNLFEYDVKGKLTINLIYDERQQLTQRNQSLETNISQTKLSVGAAEREYAALNQKYEQDYLIYESGLRQFEQAQRNYNSTVAYWNKKGGAPKNVYEQLTAQANGLLAQQKILEQKRSELVFLANEINTLISRYNLLVRKVNANIETINQTAGREFEEGTYVVDSSGVRIDIYEFGDEAKLIRVLAHELGHALGLGHNSNPDSIMYELNQSAKMGLSVEDLQAVEERCGIK